MRVVAEILGVLRARITWGLTCGYYVFCRRLVAAWGAGGCAGVCNTVCVTLCITHMGAFWACEKRVALMVFCAVARCRCAAVKVGRGRVDISYFWSGINGTSCRGIRASAAHCSGV